MMFVDGLLVPRAACRVLEIPWKAYCFHSLCKPVLWSVPSATCLICARWIFPDRPGLLFSAAGVIGGFVQAVMFYKFVLPNRLRSRLFTRVRAA
jgi:hypothetical protein